MKYALEQPIIANIGQEKYQVTILWRSGTLIVDEPEAIGGNGAGPDPTTLLLSSLAACTLATLRMYIDRKGWNIPDLAISVNLYHQLNEAKTVTVIDRQLNILSVVTAEQRERLIHIAKICPISKMLEGEIRIDTIAG